MAKVQRLSELSQSLPFTEYDFYDIYQKTFEGKEMGKMKKVLPLRQMAETFGLVDKRQVPRRGPKPYFTPEGKVALMFLMMRTRLSAPKLMDQLNGNIHYQIFCGNRRESIPDRIVSVSKPYVRPIVRGKEVKSVEFGAKCNNIMVDGISFIEKLSFNAFNEGTRLRHCVKMHRRLFGVEMKKVGGDTSYAGMDNRDFCKENGIQTSFVKRGRPSQGRKDQDYVRQELARVRATAMEGSFGIQKEHYAMRRIKARKKETEILYIFFGIHTANAVRLAERLLEGQEAEAALPGCQIGSEMESCHGNSRTPMRKTDGYQQNQVVMNGFGGKKRSNPSHLWRHHKNKRPFKSNRKNKTTIPKIMIPNASPSFVLMPLMNIVGRMSGFDS